MARYDILAVGLTACILLGGCKTSLTAPVVEKVPTPGDVYFLPRAEFVVAVDRELQKCSIDADAQLAREWLRSQTIRLRAIFDLIDGARGNPKLDQSFPKISEIFEAKAGRITVPGPPKPKNRKELEAAGEAIKRGLLVQILEDPILRNLELCNNLDRSQKTPDLLRSLEACAQKLPQPPEPKIVFDVTLRASVTPHLLPDQSQAYSIDYSLLRRSLKKTNITIEKYPGGTLKSVNAEIQDRSAEVIAGALRGVASLYGASLGIPVTAAGAAQANAPANELIDFRRWKEAEEPQLCKPHIVLALQEKAALAGKKASNDGAILKAAKNADRASSEIAARQAEIASLTKKIEEGEGDAAAHRLKIEKLKAEIAPYKDLLATATQERNELEKTNSTLTTSLTSLRASLTVTSTHHFRPDDWMAENELPGASEVAGKWFKPDQIAKACIQNNALHPDCYSEGAGPNLKNVPLALRSYVGAYTVGGSDLPAATPPLDGIVYREPARGALLVCAQTPCFSGPPKVLAVAPKDLLYSQITEFPQLGIKGVLPLSNEAFQNNTLVANFSEAGSLTRLEYISNARAEKAAEAFASSAEVIQQLAQDKREAKKNKLETKTAELAAEIELKKKELELQQAIDALAAHRSGNDDGEEDGNGEQ